MWAQIWPRAAGDRASRESRRPCPCRATADGRASRNGNISLGLYSDLIDFISAFQTWRLSNDLIGRVYVYVFRAVCHPSTRHLSPISDLLVALCGFHSFFLTRKMFVNTGESFTEVVFWTFNRGQTSVLHMKWHWNLLKHERRGLTKKNCPFIAPHCDTKEQNWNIPQYYKIYITNTINITKNYNYYCPTDRPLTPHHTHTTLHTCTHICVFILLSLFHHYFFVCLFFYQNAEKVISQSPWQVFAKCFPHDKIKILHLHSDSVLVPLSSPFWTVAWWTWVDKDR